jgi:hypothetical protein
MQSSLTRSTRLIAFAVLASVFASNIRAETAALEERTSPSLLRIMLDTDFCKKRSDGPADKLIASIRKAAAEGANLYETDEYGNDAFAFAVTCATTNAVQQEEANKVVRLMIDLGRDVNRPWIGAGQRVAPICLPLLYGTWNTDLVELMFRAGLAPSTECQGKSLEDSAASTHWSQRIVEIIRRYR